MDTKLPKRNENTIKGSMSVSEAGKKAARGLQVHMDTSSIEQSDIKAGRSAEEELKS